MPRVTNRAVEIEYEVLGHPDDPGLLLVHGAGTQLATFPDELCWGFADRGFCVVRADNRDAGLSSTLPEGSTYGFTEMAGDLVAVLDQAEQDRVVALGYSLGGLIAQTLAIEHPERVAGLVSLASTTGESNVGRATPAAEAALHAEEPTDPDAFIEQQLAGYRIWSNPEWRDEPGYRLHLERMCSRAWSPGASRRHLRVLADHVPRVDDLRALRVPTLVVHGTLDPLIDPSGGRRTAELVPDAEYLEIEGFSHALEPQMWAALISAVTALAARAEW